MASAQPYFIPRPATSAQSPLTPASFPRSFVAPVGQSPCAPFLLPPQPPNTTHNHNQNQQMKTIAEPVVVEMLAARVSGFHLPPAPNMPLYNNALPQIDSDDDLVGNPEDPLTQLAAAAAVEHKSMLAREKMHRIAQSEHELDLKKRRDNLQLDREIAKIEMEKQKLRESAAELQAKWAEFAQMQQGLVPAMVPPMSLAVMAGTVPAKPKRNNSRAAVSRLSAREPTFSLSDRLALSFAATKTRHEDHQSRPSATIALYFHGHSYRRRHPASFGRRGLCSNTRLDFVQRFP